MVSNQNGTFIPRGINSILLGTVYHPPQSDDHVLRMHIFKCLDSLLATYPNSAILVLGDFNQFKPGNLCNSFRLTKLVTKPTRESNILDQAFSTLSPYYDAIILPPIGQSDHSSILLQPILTHPPSLPTTRLQKCDYRAPNKQNLISRLNTVNWTPLVRLNSCEEQLDSFQSVVHVALNSCISMRTVKHHPNDKPWITPVIKESIKKRQQTWLNNDLHRYNVYRNKVINSARERAKDSTMTKLITCMRVILKSGGTESSCCLDFLILPVNKLSRRQQHVKLKTCKSDWKEIKAGVPQGTKLGPLFFLIMVNDLSSELPLYKYVDDCAISEVVRVCEPDLPKLQQELHNVTQWSSENNMKLNVKKTKDFTVSFFINQPLAQPLIVNNQPLEAVTTIKLLGVNLTSDLKWSAHIRDISSKASKRLYALRILRRNGVQPSDLRTVYCSFIRPVLEYACPVWHTSLPKFLTDELEHIQRCAMVLLAVDFIMSTDKVGLFKFVSIVVRSFFRLSIKFTRVSP
ncbi:Hypothetical predicted protein [Paramuricea clavata]|uniref:Reverse transcriptase domain-containing protein n=1 Tax=Paramuricea clavata TaxID=317549 RepID=A0A7D9I789_PARCT|nr:Hypothetical predicted protein [Paramuricea clavata]